MKSQRLRILLSLLCILLALPVGMFGASLLAMALSLTTDSPYGIFVTYVVMFGFVIAVSFLLRDLARPSMQRVNPLAVVWGFATILLWNCTVSPLADYLPDFGSQQLDDIARTGLMSVLTAIIIGPVMEEWIFRGIMAGNLDRLFGPLKAILVSAILFALTHVYPVQVLTAFGAGLVLGSFYMITRSLLTTVAIHMLYNGFIYCIYIFLPTESDDILVDLVPSDTARIAIWAVAFVLFVLSSRSIFRRLGCQ